MATCLSIDSSNYLLLDSETSISNCEYVILSNDEYTSAISTDLKIDSGLYVDVSGYLLLSFITGHVLGRIAKTLGKF